MLGGLFDVTDQIRGEVRQEAAFRYVNREIWRLSAGTSQQKTAALKEGRQEAACRYVNREIWRLSAGNSQQEAAVL